MKNVSDFLSKGLGTVNMTRCKLVLEQLLGTCDSAIPPGKAKSKAYELLAKNVEVLNQSTQRLSLWIDIVSHTVVEMSDKREQLEQHLSPKKVDHESLEGLSQLKFKSLGSQVSFQQEGEGIEIIGGLI